MVCLEKATQACPLMSMRPDGLSYPWDVNSFPKMMARRGQGNELACEQICCRIPKLSSLQRVFGSGVAVPAADSDATVTAPGAAGPDGVKMVGRNGT